MGRREEGRKEGMDGGMKGPVGPDGWGRFCLGLRARWRRISEAGSEGGAPAEERGAPQTHRLQPLKCPVLVFTQSRTSGR